MTLVSTDGSVTFQVEVQNSINTPDMPVIEVVPHTLTEEDARNVAFALCGSSANFYEAEPMLNERYSKREIIAQINRWAPYTSTEGMQYLFPGMDQGFWESNAQTLQESISYLTSEYLNESTIRIPRANGHSTRVLTIYMGLKPQYPMTLHETTMKFPFGHLLEMEKMDVIALLQFPVEIKKIIN